MPFDKPGTGAHAQFVKDVEERFRAEAMRNAVLPGDPPNGITTFHLCLKCAAVATEKLQAYIRQENPT